MKLVFVLIFIMTVGCSQSQKTAGKNIIKSTNLIKGIKNTTPEGLKEKTIIIAKDILDPSRGGGFKWVKKKALEY